MSVSVQAVMTLGGESQVARKTTRRGQKQCPSCKAWIKGGRTKTCPKCGYQFNGKPEAASNPEAAAVAAEKSTKATDMVTLEQVKAVAQTVKTIGGLDRVNDVLGLIRQLGGVKKFKDLLEAISVGEADNGKHMTDKPF
jgi:uncharacterized Zn finger protein (UPF0148 family)